MLVSPSQGVAWACFQLGVLWGEAHESCDIEKASFWYAKAVSYLPGYSHASVHLAEIYIENGDYKEAQHLLSSVIENDDPEVRWRMSDLFASKGDLQTANTELAIAKSMYDHLLSKHRLAFADHAAEFYLDSGNDPEKALQLSMCNFNNRPTPRAYDLATQAALANGRQDILETLTIAMQTKEAMTND